MAKGKRRYQRNPVVTEVPAKCRACGSFDRKILRTDSLPGTPGMFDGKDHMGIILRRVRCLDCGQHYCVKSPLVKNKKGRKKRPTVSNGLLPPGLGEKLSTG